MCFSLCPLSLLLSVGTTEESLAQFSLLFTTRYFQKMVKSLWSLLFFKLNSPSSLPLHTGEMLQSLITCVVSHQTCSSISQSLGSAEVNSELWGCLSSAEWKERITSFSLQAILFLVQPRMLLSALATGTHCWLMFSFLSSRILGASLPSCFPSRC